MIMFRWLALFSVLIVTNHSYANSFMDIEGSLSAFRQDARLQWNIGSSPHGNTTPNILSELTYDDLEVEGAHATVGVAFKKGVPGLYLEGSVLDGASDNGDYQDSDYFGDDRTDEFSRSIGDAEVDVEEVKIAVGYKAIFPIDDAMTIHAKLMLGMAESEQEITSTNGVQVLDPYGFIGFLGPFAGLNSTYDTEWESKWLGVEFDGMLFDKHNVFYRGEYHFADYYAVANWNLRADFAHPKSFEHTADGGHGVVMKIGYEYYILPLLGIQVMYSYDQWIAEDGMDKTFFANGTTGKVQFREVEWKSKGISAGVNFRF